MITATYPQHIKLSPSTIIAALSCPRKYKYRYVDELESSSVSARFAFGRAVHKGIEFAYGRRKTSPGVEDVARVFSMHFALLDEQGISYREKESYEALDEKGRALVALWWETYGDEVRAVADEPLIVEACLSHDVEVGLTLFGHPDVIEERDGLLYIGDHKTLAQWGPSWETMVAQSPQLTLYGYLCHKKLGRYPDVYYWTVLKKTKTPEAFRHFTTRTPEEVDAFEDQAREVAALIRHWEARGRYLRNAGLECHRCQYHPLCLDLEGAADSFRPRERRGDEPEAGDG